MSDEMKHNITAFLSEQKQYFNQHGVDTISFGQQLSLTKASLSRKTGSIPEALDEIIHALDPNNSMKYNSIVIRRFSDSTCSAHNSFADKSITPESNIYTLTIGGPLVIAFKNKVTGGEEVLNVEDNSSFTMTQQSQFYWSHSTTSGPTSDSFRYTVSFLCTGNNHNATLILGDSNTYNIKFQNERNWSTLGKYITEKRYTCYLLEDIDLKKCLGHRNIIFHLGINHQKDRYQNNKGITGQFDIPAVFDSWLTTLTKLRNLCSYSKIVESPVLPTKISALNSRAITFNRLIFSCINKFWIELDFNSFLNESGLLDDNYGRRFNIETGKKDKIHLGRLGISRLGLMFKDAILGKPGRINGRSYVDVIKGSGTVHVS